MNSHTNGLGPILGRLVHKLEMLDSPTILDCVELVKKLNERDFGKFYQDVTKLPLKIRQACFEEFLSFGRLDNGVNSRADAALNLSSFLRHRCREKEKQQAFLN